MADELTPEEQKALEDLNEAVAASLVQGTGKDKIVKELVKQGWNADEAADYVNAVEQSVNDYKNSPEGRKVIAGKYKRHMIWGLVWAVGGTIVTAATYSAASEKGGHYVIAWGAILFGVVDFFRGLFGWMNHSS